MSAPEQTTIRPHGANADEWLVFLREHSDYPEFVAVQIAEAIEAERERCARLHESVNPASDDERLHNVPGAGAMGAVIEYRDLIRARYRPNPLLWRKSLFQFCQACARYADALAYVILL